MRSNRKSGAVVIGYDPAKAFIESQARKRATEVKRKRRTTVHVGGDVVVQLRKIANARGQSLSQLTAEILRRALKEGRL